MNLRAPLAVFASLLLAGSLRANDGIFPPQPAAAAAIHFDGHGFVIGGTPTILLSGSLHYPRVPRELWRDRLLRYKNAGLTGVETYAFWNYHEPREGQFDAQADKDFDDFLSLAQELGLYVTVRVGPYVCAEWENGGYPNWLRENPDVRVRLDDPAFLKATDRWYEHILPVVARHQIHRGGSVILVQLENEYPLGWGTDSTPYLDHLRQKALALGIEVPVFFSGLHHGGEPSPQTPINPASRTAPWYSTESWYGWYSLYGPLPPQGGRSVWTFARGFWRLLAMGGAGLNDYMFHGGTNFDGWNDNESAASYDYGAVVGEAGDLRPLYYAMKRAALFARSFGTLLADDENAPARAAAIAPGAAAWAQDVSALRVAAREGKAGVAAFLDNPGQAEAPCRLDDGSELRLAPGETAGLVRGFALSDAFRLDASVRVLGFVRQGKTVTLVVYGPPGEKARLAVSAPGAPAPAAPWQADPATPSRFVLAPEFSDDAPRAYLLPGKDGALLRVVAVGPALADRTWLLPQGVVAGPAFVREIDGDPAHPTVSAEEPGWQAPRPAVFYGEAPDPVRLAEAGGPGPAPLGPLAGWKVQPACPEAEADYDDAAWPQSQAPLPMGRDGNRTRYAWYRAKVTVPEAGKYYLQAVRAGDQALVFVNGNGPIVPQGSPFSVPVDLKAGANAIAVLVSHSGRLKFFDTLGPVDRIDPKGLLGPITLTSDKRPYAEVSWAVKNGVPDGDLSPADPQWKPGSDWKTIWLGGTGYIHGRLPKGASWYRATLPDLPGPDRRLRIGVAYDEAEVFLNGKSLAKGVTHDADLEVPLDAAWRSGGPNVVAIRVANTTGDGGVLGRVVATSGDPAATVAGWRMKEALTPPDDAAWREPAALKRPAYAQARFSYAPTPADSGRVLRLTLAGLTRGEAWLNGHDLGRYPAKIPAPGLYLPESWLKPGENTVTILDEAGGDPRQAAVVEESGATRRSVVLR